MKYETYGRENNPGRVVELYIEENNNSIQDLLENRYRLIVVKKGAIFITSQNKKRILESPSIICINNKQSIEAVGADNLEFITVYFSPNVVNSLLTIKFLENIDNSILTESQFQDLFYLDAFNYKNNQELCIMQIGENSLKKILILIEKIKNQLDFQDDGLWPCRSRSVFIELLFYIFNIRGSDPLNNIIFSNTDSLFEKILLYLHSNFHEQILLSDLSVKFSTNRTSINKMFIEFTGKSIINYLIDIRMKFAALLLRDSYIPIKEIFLRCGYHDQSNFSKAFKKYSNMSPSEYRKEYYC